jgi:hypothetical protein
VFLVWTQPELQGWWLSGLGENFAGPLSLPATMTHTCAIHLLGGGAARPLPPLDPQALPGGRPVVEVPRGLQSWCGGGLLVWTWPRLLRCCRRQGSLFMDQVDASAGLMLYVLSFVWVSVCAWRVCVVTSGVLPSRLMASLIQSRAHFEPSV